MNPLSHTTYTTSAAPEQVCTTDALTPDTVSNSVLIHNLFPYLGPSDLHHVGQACRRFRDTSRRVWQLRAQEICRACAELLPSFGITPPGTDPTPEEASAFLNRTVQRVKEINTSLPGDLQSQFSTDDLVCKVGSGHMQEFLQRAYDHSLRAMFGKLAHVPEDASLEEAVRRIREWLQTAEAGEVQILSSCLPTIDPSDVPHSTDRILVCLPREIELLTGLRCLMLNHHRFTSLPPAIGQLTALRMLGLRGDQLASLPPEIGRLSQLQELFLDGNRLTSLPPEIGQLTALRTLYLDNNRLTSLPPEIGQLTALRRLDLGGNRLIYRSPEIRQLASRGVHMDPIFPAGEEDRPSTVSAGVVAAIRQVIAQAWQALL